MSDFTSILPTNASPLKRSLEQALRGEIIGKPHILPVLHDPMRCPEAALPHLAWALSVDFWNESWPVAQKRQVIASSLMVHRLKGSVGAVRRALAALDCQMRLREWFEMPASRIHTFEVTAIPEWDFLQHQYNDPTLPILHTDLIADIRSAVSWSKPLRSHFSFWMGMQAQSTVKAQSGAALRDALKAEQNAPVSLASLPSAKFLRRRAALPRIAASCARPVCSPHKSHFLHLAQI